jgi:hypothetical protein
VLYYQQTTTMATPRDIIDEEFRAYLQGALGCSKEVFNASTMTERMSWLNYFDQKKQQQQQQQQGQQQQREQQQQHFLSELLRQQQQQQVQQHVLSELVWQPQQQQGQQQQHVLSELVYRHDARNGADPKIFRDRVPAAKILEMLPLSVEACSDDAAITRVLLYGPPASGKTSIMGKIYYALQERYSPLTPVYIVCR